MKIKRIILSTIFVAGIIVASTSCSQTDEMDDGDTGGGTRPPSNSSKATEIDSTEKIKSDSINYTLK
ncbi:hypothetical protein [Dysgonomonas sp. ZJ709]|uniref:hypothetical protein n=1 Tax=Dysgonomonas sp. ZJ709 TaxID=2709797 RepID=UPI0013ECC1C2|nr:hypothetical protein [Dysgonomonas sp. ZJ709]